MTPIEKETIVNFNEEEDFAEVYSCQKFIWTKCEKLGMKLTSTVKNKEGTIISKTYECPKKWIRFIKTREYSEEHKERLRKQLERGRQNKK